MTKAKSINDVRIIIIGAGMAGILAVIRLREFGYNNFAIYEKADHLGGTWRDNTYPGLACDVPAHLYTYSFEHNPDWSHAYGGGAEIQAYFEMVAKKYNVTQAIHFNQEVTHCEFKDGKWKIRTVTGHEDEAHVIIAASGVLHHQNTPDIPGLDSFGGARFHSTEWDHSVELEGKRVGVVGTGSTAVQIATALVDKVSHFDLFQRSAQWIMPSENPKVSEEEKAALRADPRALDIMRTQISEDFSHFSNAVVDADSPEMKQIEEACLANLEGVRDPELREKLRPNYRAGCKRLVFSPNFYEKIQHPNAEVVTSGIKGVEPGGIRTEDGELHELDVLVMATGFDVSRFIRPTTVLGRGGIDLDDVWSEHPYAYLSISVPEFPNFFFITGPNSPIGNFSLIQLAESQVSYIMQLVGQIRAGQCSEISASASAMADFEAERSEAAKNSIWATGCTSWYLDKNGVPLIWPWTPSHFFEEMASPKLRAFDMV